jgi:guanylate kinase
VTEIIAAACATPKNETSHYSEYDYLVVNDDFGDL